MFGGGSGIWNWKRLFPAGGAGKRRLPSGGGLLFNSATASMSQSSTIGIAGGNHPQRHNNSHNRRTTMDLRLQLNPFRLCSGLKVLGYLMIVLVVAIIALSYYAVVVITWGPHLLDGGFASLFSFLIVILFHYLIVLLTWSYIMVVLRDPGSVPENWKSVSDGNIEEGNPTAIPGGLGPQNPASAMSSLDGVEIGSAVRYCSHCRNGKPPRCHHCSICQRCVLKMDHHCIWVVNCVGAQNYKFFLLFVFYTFLETTMDTFVLLPGFIKFFEQAKHRSLSPGNLAVTFLAFILNLAFALSLLCFVIMHTSLLLSNTTSVEVYEKKRAIRWKYDLGRKRNFEQHWLSVFKNKLHASLLRPVQFLVIFSSGALYLVPLIFSYGPPPWPRQGQLVEIKSAPPWKVETPHFLFRQTPPTPTRPRFARRPI